MKNTRKRQNPRLPKGWTLADIEAVRKHYESQTEAEAAAEDEAAFKNRRFTMVAVPIKLLPKVQRLLTSANK
jgi:hypothetical protein